MKRLLILAAVSAMLSLPQGARRARSAARAPLEWPSRSDYIPLFRRHSISASQMPTYEFRCPVGHEFERFYGRISESPSEVACPECGAMAERHPAAILMDVDFAGPGVGLALAKDLQQSLKQRLPLLFFSQQEPSTQLRLAAVRCGASEFFTENLDASTLLERIEVLAQVSHYDPYQVLIVDDSRAQALHTERVLNGAGIATPVISGGGFNSEIVMVGLSTMQTSAGQRRKPPDVL